jgi:hypothetical protein
MFHSDRASKSIHFHTKELDLVNILFDDEQKLQINIGNSVGGIVLMLEGRGSRPKGYIDEK